jgi:hypothetical protein
VFGAALAGSERRCAVIACPCINFIEDDQGAPSLPGLDAKPQEP